MRKYRIIGIIVLCMLLLCGCTVRESVKTEYQVYYTNREKTALLSAGFSSQGDTTEERLVDIWNEMISAPASGELVSLVPEDIEMTGMDLTDGQLTLTFNGAYYNMDNVSEILLRSGVVEGMTQFGDVKRIVFHIGEDVLRDKTGEPVGAMTRSDFINNPVGINSYQYASLTLYYSNFLGDAVVKEMRNVHYSSNTTLEKVVLEQLLKGPMNKKLNPVLNADIKVLGVSVEGKTCTVNFSKEFLAKNSMDVKPEVVIYSIVNSLCDVLEVDKVQFQVEGSSEVIYADELNLEGPFHRKSDIIETIDTMTDLESEGDDGNIAEPSIGL